MHFAAELHKEGVKAGLSVLPETSIDSVEQIINSFDHLLIFAGHLGHFGGKADLSLLSKVAEAKEHHPELEIGWDGGVNDTNARQLAEGGVDVLNVGGFLQSADNPAGAYVKLKSELPTGVKDETKTIP
jgi:ribulose-phosphate 3-epimerase